VDPADRAQLIKEHCVPIGTVSQNGTVGRSTFHLIAHLRARRLRWLGHILQLPETELLKQIVMKVAWPRRHAHPGGIFMDAPPTASQDDTLAIGELHYLAGNHHTEWGRDNCLQPQQPSGATLYALHIHRSSHSYLYSSLQDSPHCVT
jgi:hypothetical protein